MASIPEDDPRYAGPPTQCEGAREPFRFSMLLGDARYRAITLQVFALLAFAALVVFLGFNVSEKFEESGKTFSFSFLWQPASYDIDQTLIDYTSRSPHWKAAVVGILNTFLVAIMGIVTATVLGVLAGVARLSKNWLVARLMTVYVEIFRNVPLLIWLLVLIAVFTTVFPVPRNAWTLGGLFDGLLGLLSFGLYDAGENGENSIFGAIVALTNRGMRVTAPVFEEGSGWVVAAFLASLAGMWALRRYAKAQQEATGRIIPWLRIGVLGVIVVTVAAYYLAGQPISRDPVVLGRFNMTGGWRISGGLFALWLGLSLYTGAFIAEIVRAGILAVSTGQREAAAALGLQPNRVMNLVILPQALRVIIPPLISQYLNLIKNSSLAIATGYMDITGTLGGITLNQTGREMEALLMVMGFYLIVSLTLSAVMNAYNNRVVLKER